MDPRGSCWRGKWIFPRPERIPGTGRRELKSRPLEMGHAAEQTDVRPKRRLLVY